MKLRITTALLLACMTATMMATERTDAEKKLVAEQILHQSVGHRAGTFHTLKTLIQQDMLTVIGHEQEGFVVVANNDEFSAVVGYSQVPFTSFPPALEWYLAAANQTMQDMVANHVRRTTIPPSAEYPSSLGPLLTTTWDQGSPYNKLCPGGNGSSTRLYPTGCVATALAQVMKYHNYPIKGNGEHQYSFQPSSGDGRIIEANFGETTYEWDKMLDNYKSSYTDEEALAVATLMLHCGVAVDMDYTPSGSGAYGVEACQALKKYFSYNKNTRLYTRNFYSAEAWMQMIYKELNQYGPIYYSGVNPSSGGHAFVLEGYDETGLVRINWGWGGSSNGLFDIALLNPSGSQYSAEQQMILKLDPSVETPYESQIVAETLTFTIPSTKKSVTITGRVYNAGAEKFAGQLVCVLQNTADRSITTLRTSDEMAMEPITNGQYWIKNFSLPANSLSSVANGTYRLYVGSRTADDSSWQLVRPKEGEINSYLITKTDEGVTWEECRTDLWSIGVPTSIHPVVKSMPNTNAPLRFYDFQGREVNAGTKGMVIRKQGNEVKKVVVR